jgi:hypothetical protein
LLDAPGVLSSEFERHTQEVVRKLVSLLVTDRLTDRKDKQKLKLGRLMKKGGVEKLENRERAKTRDRQRIRQA